MRKPLTAVLFAGMLALAACSGDGVTTTSQLGDTTTTDAGATSSSEGDLSGAIDEIETEIDALQTQIQNSAAATELQSAWTDLTAELTAAMSSMVQDGVVDSTAVEAALDDFQADVEALGDEVEPELVTAWETLRAKIESLMS